MVSEPLKSGKLEVSLQPASEDRDATCSEVEMHLYPHIISSENTLQTPENIYWLPRHHLT